MGQFSIGDTVYQRRHGYEGTVKDVTRDGLVVVIASDDNIERYYAPDALMSEAEYEEKNTVSQTAQPQELPDSMCALVADTVKKLRVSVRQSPGVGSWCAWLMGF
jgi:hypothetical protein